MAGLYDTPEEKISNLEKRQDDLEAKQRDLDADNAAAEYSNANHGVSPKVHPIVTDKDAADPFRNIDLSKINLPDK